MTQPDSDPFAAYFFTTWAQLTNFSIKEKWPACRHVLRAHWVFGAVQQKLFRAHYYGIFVVWRDSSGRGHNGGGVVGYGMRCPRVPPPALSAPRRASSHTSVIHLRYAHKTNRPRNGRPTFPLLLNLFISLLILNLNLNVSCKMLKRKNSSIFEVFLVSNYRLYYKTK